MPRTGETTQDARQILLGYLEGGQTGCLVAHSPDRGEVQVYVMLGEVLAAHVVDDGQRVLRLLRNEGALDPRALEGLDVRVTGGMPISEALFDAVPDSRVLDLLFERFRDNLFAYLAASRVGEFTPMEAVFTDNIQVGHDSRALIDELWQLRRDVAGLLGADDLVLVPGALPPRGDEQGRILSLCIGGVALPDVIGRSAVEPSRTLATLQEMLQDGVVTTRAPELPDDDFTDSDPITEEHAREAASAPTGRSVRFEPPDPELAAFQDYDTSRIGGDFTSERSLLDRVDLTMEPPKPSLAASTETVIEMEDAENAKALGAAVVSLNFSGPKLHEEEVERKIGVVNEVLATVAEALDAVEGRGAGQAHVQLLVEGSTGGIAPLFKGIEVMADGRLPAATLMKNLRKRPEAEHRRLLNRGLSDLIDRALSLANEALDEERLEALLERIAGYQQRLGI